MKRLALVGVLLLTACSGEPEVPWNEYAPELRDDIDQAIESGDCGQMQQQLDRAVEGDNAHRAKYGTGNADLMDYILDAMTNADCP